jgi:hypothetical protein
VPDGLARSCRLADSVFVSMVKEKLLQLCQELSRGGIKVELRIEDIGLSLEGEPKLWVQHGFEVVPDEGNHLEQEYQVQIDRLFEQQAGTKHSMKAPSELSDYSYRLDKKITEIEDRLNKRKKRRRSKCSSPERETASEQEKKLQGLELSCKYSSGSMNSEQTRYSTM